MRFNESKVAPPHCDVLHQIVYARELRSPKTNTHPVHYRDSRTVGRTRRSRKNSPCNTKPQRGSGRLLHIDGKGRERQENFQLAKGMSKRAHQSVSNLHLLRTNPRGPISHTIFDIHRKFKPWRFSKILLTTPSSAWKSNGVRSIHFGGGLSPPGTPHHFLFNASTFKAGKILS